MALVYSEPEPHAQAIFVALRQLIDEAPRYFMRPSKNFTVAVTTKCQCPTLFSGVRRYSHATQHTCSAKIKFVTGRLP